MNFYEKILKSAIRGKKVKSTSENSEPYSVILVRISNDQSSMENKSGDKTADTSEETNKKTKRKIGEPSLINGHT